ncbi:hypothetical protein [Bythopirellula polymerisocia]|uniref:hypothetical protein n=1 Tax=Bythopirellula polymerisocia TaxID=2528003 RepID=UPI0018D41902|nr:hypothetical protein [Bythopirellula polymerisocia]
MNNSHRLSPRLEGLRAILGASWGLNFSRLLQTSPFFCGFSDFTIATAVWVDREEWT